MEQAVQHTTRLWSFGATRVDFEDFLLVTDTAVSIITSRAAHRKALGPKKPHKWWFLTWDRWPTANSTFLRCRQKKRLLTLMFVIPIVIDDSHGLVLVNFPQYRCSGGPDNHRNQMTSQHIWLLLITCPVSIVHWSLVNTIVMVSSTWVAC